LISLLLLLMMLLLLLLLFLLLFSQEDSLLQCLHLGFATFAFLFGRFELRRGFLFPLFLLLGFLLGPTLGHPRLTVQIITRTTRRGGVVIVVVAAAPQQC